MFTVTNKYEFIRSGYSEVAEAVPNFDLIRHSFVHESLTAALEPYTLN